MLLILSQNYLRMEIFDLNKYAVENIEGATYLIIKITTPSIVQFEYISVKVYPDNDEETPKEDESEKEGEKEGEKEEENEKGGEKEGEKEGENEEEKGKRRERERRPRGISGQPGRQGQATGGQERTTAVRNEHRQVVVLLQHYDQELGQDTVPATVGQPQARGQLAPAQQDGALVQRQWQ